MIEETVMKYQWVIARYAPKSANGIGALAESVKGLGYILINSDRSASDPVVVAFKKPMNDILSHHLDLANEAQTAKFEEIAKSRSGSR